MVCSLSWTTLGHIRTTFDASRASREKNTLKKNGPYVLTDGPFFGNMYSSFRERYKRQRPSKCVQKCSNSKNRPLQNPCLTKLRFWSIFGKNRIKYHMIIKRKFDHFLASKYWADCITSSQKALIFSQKHILLIGIQMSQFS